MYKVLIINLLLLSAIPAMAQDDGGSGNEGPNELQLFDQDEERTELGWSRFYVAVGAAYQDADGGFKVNLPNGESVDIINFDRVGLKETDSTYWLSLNYRSIDSRWGAWFGSWRYDVTGDRQWEDELVIPGKEPIPTGADVTSTFDAKWYILEATYSFFRSETIDTGIGFGLHTVDLRTTVTARVELADDSTEVVSEKLDTLAPLPNVLVYVHWKFAPRWSLVSRIGWFGLDYKDHSGEMTNAHAMVHYEMSPRWSLGGGYQFVSLDLKTQEKNYVKDYNIDFSGPMAWVRFNF